MRWGAGLHDDTAGGAAVTWRVAGGDGRGGRQPRATHRAAVLAAAGAALLSSACVHDSSLIRRAPGTAPSPAEPWIPPAEVAAPAPPPGATGGAAPGAPGAIGPASTGGAPAIPPELQKTAGQWTLADLVDLALRNSPQTRFTWAQARSAAAGLGAEKGSYLPTLAADISGTRQKGSAVGGQFTYYSTSYNPAVHLNWLLLDFGGRKASVESARQALIAADWAHNQAIQDVVLAVEQAYYQYLDAAALEEAEKAAVSEAEASLDAAERRRAAGLSTVADVLQAKTRLSETRLLLDTVQGQIQIVHGTLATAVGLPANTRFDLDVPPPEVPQDRVAVEVDRAIQEAQARRPDLSTARALAEKADADVRAQAALIRPTVTLGATAGRISYESSNLSQDTYSSGLLVTIPIFNGLTWQYNLRKTEADRDAARAQVDTLSQRVTLQVWTSYFDHHTAERNIETTRDLLDSARQSYDVAAARYKAGVGSILDLLTAQSALQVARAAEVRARTNWFLTLAQLAHDTGTLWTSTDETGPPEERGPR